VSRCGVEYGLDAVEIRRERRYQHATGRFTELALEDRGECPLAGNPAGALRVRAVADEQEHALITELRESAGVEEPAVYGSLIDLEVARMYDGADRCEEREADRVGD